MPDLAALRASIAANLAAFKRQPQNSPDLKAAAVALALTTDEAGEPAFFLTRRAPRLNSHSGQWALPGGRLDPGEDAIGAALREMDEEIGVRLDAQSVLGLLDDYVTRSGYCMTPVVVWAGPDAEATANPAEVAGIFRIPLAETLGEGFVEMIPVDGSAHPMIRLRIGGGQMHAPTAAVIYQFREVALSGRHTRVADLLAPGWTAR